MKTSVINRRSFLISSLGVALGSALPSCLLQAATPFRTRWVLSGLYDHHKKTFAIGILDFAKNRRFDLPVEHHGHGLCLHPTKPDRAIIFAQRPGTVSYEFDFVKGEVTNRFETNQGRHFYGHGLGVAARNAIFCTENHYADGAGIVTIRDPENFEVKGEFSTHGVGPHDMRFLDDGATIAIANGGHATKPDGKGGVILLNQVPMASLVLVDALTGELKEQIPFPKSQLKHLHASPRGVLGMALRGRREALCVVRHPDGRLVRAKDHDGLFQKMSHHTLSIRVCDRTHTVAVSAPKGNLVAFWDTRTGELKKVLPLRAAVGLEVTHDEQHFLVTSRGGAKPQGLNNESVRAERANGRILLIDTKTLEPVAHQIPEPTGTIWASHALAVAEEPGGTG